MRQEKTKSHLRYIFYRAYCIIVIGMWNVFGFWMLLHKTTPEPLLKMVPLILPAIFLLESIAIFPFKFSVFGRYERTPLPQEKPLLIQKYSWGQIKWFHASPPFFNWYVYPSGLGISIIGCGKFFILTEDIVSIEKYFLQGYKLIHNSPEVRNPIIFPGKRIFEALQDAAKSRGRALDIK